MQLHHISGHIQSIYLAEYCHGLLLLDGCCRADVPALREFIEQQLQRPFSDLQLVVVTHMHPDHAGAAHKLRELTGCRIASAQHDYPWYRGFSGSLMYLTDVALANWVAGRMNKPRRNLFYPRALQPDIRLADGQRLPGFDEWQVLETPGHTDRDLSLLHVPGKRIYVADLVVTVKGRFIAPFPVFYPNRYLASVAKIRSMRDHSLLLAHGGEVSLSEQDYQHLLTRAPKEPKTPWRTVKGKTARILGLA